MARTTIQPVASPPTESVVSMLSWPVAMAETLFQAQRAQFEAMITWQQAVAGFGREMWDDWIAHWAGGVPLDA